jgi:hypothetical protein
MPNTLEAVRLVHLPSMNTREAQNFKASVASSGGALFTYIHPFYGDRGRLNVSKSNAEYRRYEARRASEIPSLIASGKPVLIFEEGGHVGELPNRIGSKTGTPLYSVITEKAFADPLGSNWDTLGDILHEANVRQINIGGVSLELLHGVSKSAQQIREKLMDIAASGNETAYRMIQRDLLPDPEYCVGKAALELLARGFNISFSLATYPDLEKFAA